MNRTTIMLPEGLKNKAQMLAIMKGISLGELVREALEQRLSRSKALKARDPFFDDDNFYKGKLPSDLSTNHDEYLYK